MIHLEVGLGWEGTLTLPCVTFPTQPTSKSIMSVTLGSKLSEREAKVPLPRVTNGGFIFPREQTYMK